MALDTTSSESTQDAVRNSGFYCEKDPLVGGEFSRMQREDFTLLSKDGLEFYEVNILNKEVHSSSVLILVGSGSHPHQHVRSVLDSMLPGYGLARCRHFHSDPGHRFRFRSGGERPGPKVIAVMLWDKACKVKLYRDSHQFDIPGVQASNGLFEIPAAKLELGKAEWFTFLHGGLYVQERPCMTFSG